MLLAGAANAIIFAVGLGPSRDGGIVVPRGWEWVERVVWFGWVVLFAGMGLAAWLAARSGRATAGIDARLIWALIVICLLYPLYTLGFRIIPGRIGNIAVLVLTCVLAGVVRRTSRAAAALLVPVALWVAVATVYVVKLIQANQLL